MIIQNPDPFDYTSLPSFFIIPDQVTYDGTTYNITAIGHYAFADKLLMEVYIPSSIKDIGIYAFSGNQLTDIVISEGVMNIEDSAFIGNKLTSVVIPESVTNIEEYAFYGNPLINVIALGSTPPTTKDSTFEKLEDNVFSNRTNITLMIPPGTTNAYTTTGWTGFKEITEEVAIWSGNNGSD